MRTLLLLCFALLLTSCINRDSGDYAQAVNSWHGGNANQLLKVWGKPYMTITSGGNTVYTY